MRLWIYPAFLLGLAGCSSNEPSSTPAPQLKLKTISQNDPVEQPNYFEGVLALAKKGNYQAQRNLAYGYVEHVYKGQDKNPILGCAWYKLIIKSGSEKVNSTDINNIDVHCSKLSDTEKEAAEAQAVALHKKIYPQ